MTKLKTTELFVRQAKSKHGDKYNYDQVRYINTRTKVTIYCKNCEESFSQLPACHIRGHGCNKCGIKSGSIKNKLNLEEFVKNAKKVHGDKYNYDLVDYVGSRTKVIIFCVSCNKTFSQRPVHHLRGSGCMECGAKLSIDKRKDNNHIFIEKAKIVHGDRYNYDLVNYVRTDSKITIFCISCNKSFEQTPNHHIRGKGCPYHVNKTEMKLYDWLTEQKYEVKKEHRFKETKKSRFDFYLPNHNLVIELDGKQHFEQVRNWNSPEETQAKDKLKMDYCIKNNISMIRLLQEDVFNDKYDWQEELTKYIKVYDKSIVKMLEKGNQYEVFNKYKQYNPDL